MSIRYLLIILFATCFGIAKSQTGMTLEFVPKLDTILIGDQITLKVSVNSSKNELIVFPEFKDQPEAGIEILKSEAIDTVKMAKDSVFRLEKRYLLTSFDPGIVPFSEFKVLRVRKSSIDTIKCEHDLFLIVKGVELNSDFQPFDIKDIKTYPSLLWLWILLGCAGFLLIAGLVFFLVKKYRKPKVVVPRQIIDPYKWAIEELEKLQNANIETIRTKDYYSKLTDIAKEYIELQTGVSAMEKTSDEILALLPSTIFSDQQLIKYLADLFHTADFVKFAKYQASLYECKTNWSDTHNFVQQSNIAANELKQLKLKQSNNEEHISDIS